MGPLNGITVLEIGSFIAGPFAGQLLGDYGAEVIKIEQPGRGDPMRTWGSTVDGESLWWPAIARNKRSVTLDLRHPKAQELVRQIVRSCDIVLENFRPGTLRQWGLEYETLKRINPRLIMVHVSGFGQTGPYSDQAGFGSVAEAVGGIRYTTGSPDQPPARAGISLGDSLASLFAVVGALAALNERRESGVGQEVDVAIYEAVFALMESTVADFHCNGVVRSRSGSTLPGVAPSNVYPTSDGADIVIAANADAVFARLLEALEMSEIAGDERFATHQSRGEHMKQLDEFLAERTRTFCAEDLLQLLRRYAVPAARINTAESILSDPHFAQREMILWAEVARDVKIPMNGIVPKFSRTPGNVRTVGPALGSDTERLLSQLAGVDSEELARLRHDGAL